MNIVSLRDFKKDKNVRARNVIIIIMWEIANFLVLENWLCTFYSFKRFVLKAFGAKIGRDVIVKQGVSIKYPWKLKIGDYSWIGEGVWIDNIVSVEIGSNVCISQGAYICTGNHDWSKKDFPLTAKAIVIEDGVWVGAKAIVCPGITLKNHSVITAGSVVTTDTEPYKIYQGNPAKPIKERKIK